MHRKPGNLSWRRTQHKVQWTGNNAFHLAPHIANRSAFLRKRGANLGTYSIAVLPGDGIGPEVTEQAVHVLQTVANHYGHTFNTTRALVGGAAIEAEGDAISDATMTLCQQSDAILFRSEEHTSELQSPDHLVSRLLLEKKKPIHP